MSHNSAPKLIDTILSRQSVGPRHLGPPGPTMDDLLQIATAASAAPDHGRLGPLRLIALPMKTRPALADAFARAALEKDPNATPEAITQAQDRALAGDTLVAVIAQIIDNHPVIPAHEQWISVGAGLQNALLAATALGFGTKMVSGARVRSEALRNAFGLGRAEHLVGFIAIGTAAADPKPANRRDAVAVLSIWPGA